MQVNEHDVRRQFQSVLRSIQSDGWKGARFVHALVVGTDREPVYDGREPDKKILVGKVIGTTLETQHCYFCSRTFIHTETVLAVNPGRAGYVYLCADRGTCRERRAAMVRVIETVVLPKQEFERGLNPVFRDTVEKQEQRMDRIKSAADDAVDQDEEKRMQS